jgi:DNA-binding NarL/FixJ family response regulator
MADRFGVVEQTIKNRLSALYRKVKVSNRVALALLIGTAAREKHIRPESDPQLTSREHKIVRAVLEGCTNCEMAVRFGTGEQTVKNQVSALYDKLGVSSRLELVLKMACR